MMTSKVILSCRCRHRKIQDTLIVFMVLNLVVCLGLMAVLHNWETSNGANYPWFPTPRYDPFQCEVPRMCTWNPTSTSDKVDKEPEIKPPKSRPVCLTSETRRADIDMEAVLDVASVGYPTLVLSVTGWHEVVKVDSWSVKPLHVIVVPFSHQDPGKSRSLPP